MEQKLPILSRNDWICKRTFCCNGLAHFSRSIFAIVLLSNLFFGLNSGLAQAEFPLVESGKLTFGADLEGGAPYGPLSKS